MSFREKTAWVTLAALLFVIALYLFHVPSFYEPRRGGWALMALSVCVGVFVVIEIVAHLVLALRNPRDARTPRDELDKLIELKALRIAAYTYFAGSFVAIFVTIHLMASSPGLVGMGVVAAFVLAELANCVARIIYYRRSA